MQSGPQIGAISDEIQAAEDAAAESRGRSESSSRKQTRVETRLRESVERYSTLVTATSNMVWVANAQGDIIEEIQYWENATGQSPEEYKSWNWLRALHPEDAVWVEEKWRKTVEARASIEMEYRLRMHSGEYRRISIRGVPMPTIAGEFRGWVGTIADVEDQRRAEEALRQSENLKRRAFDVANLYAWDLDLETGVVVFSENFSNLIGLDDKMVGSDLDWVLNLIHPEDREMIAQKIKDALISGKLEADYRFNDPETGQTIGWFHAVGETVYEESGNPTRLVGVAQDITLRRGAEDTLRATSEQLRALSARLNSAREEEGTRISRELHDELGSALTSLKWDLESLGKLIPAHGPELSRLARQKKIEGMNESIDAIINTVRRISSELRPSILDNLGLAAAIEWQAKQFESRTKIPCRFSSSVELIDLSKEQITAIFRIFKECLTNILRHAQATEVSVRIDGGERELLFEIEDNGIGISDAQRNGSQSLGLIGMRERALLIGGTIEIVGIENKGTKVTLSAPWIPPARPKMTIREVQKS